jgi:putative phosphoribosyl transferase
VLARVCRAAWRLEQAGRERAWALASALAEGVPARVRIGAAALWAAAEPGAGTAAVVSRGGRPDLARPRLAAVTAPTLLIVGGDDEVVLDLNRRAQAELRCENGLAVVPGATHLFEEPGTLDAAAGLARDWFISHLTHSPGR